MSWGLGLLLALPLAGCDRSPRADKQASVVAAPAAPSGPVVAAPVPPAWPVGDWQAELEPGVMKLTMKEAGEVRGTFDHRGAKVDVSGLFERDPAVLRLKLTSSTFYGTLVSTRQGQTWVGQLRASPQADATFENDAGPLGEEWNVTLHRKEPGAEERK